MKFRPTLTTAPTESPVSLEEVKAQAVVDFSDDDTLLTGLRDAAVAYLDGFRGILGRAMVDQTWALQVPAWRREIILPVPDVSAVVVTYSDTNGDTQAVTDFTTYDVPTGTLVRFSDDFAFPSLESDNAGPISLAFTCGFGGPADVPDVLKLAVTALAASWYEGRSSEAGESLPMGVEALVAPYRWNVI